MLPAVFFAVVLLFSVAAGVMGAILGLGGGVILVPFLTLVMGLNIHYAIGASLVSVIATSSGAAATYVRSKISNLKIGLFLSMATTVGAISGAYLAGVIPTRVLFIIFGVVLAYSALAMFRKRKTELPVGVKNCAISDYLCLNDSYHDPALNREVDYGVSGALPGLGLMYVAGAASGLLGIGSGILKVPAMDLVMRLPMKVSSATSNFMIGITAAASAAVYFLRGDINPFIAAPVAIGVLTGAMMGTHFLHNFTSSGIRTFFVVILVVVSLQMLLKGAGVTFY
ncbi:MAG: sulfite exporter TauE/SafE family protein [Peptococcaceae bacterium]|jgi:uncharacterized membrane protein YfcA|nr:sulfite exporter TauE/SafE family protein [Peptococcaceae bacterium]